MYRKVVSVIILVSFPSYLGGCTSMRYLSPEEIPAVQQKSVVWVITTDGNQYKIKEPKLEGSKLVGYLEGIGLTEINLSEIKSIGTKEINPRRALGFSAIGIAGVIILISFLTKGVSWGGKPDSDNRTQKSDS